MSAPCRRCHDPRATLYRWPSPGQDVPETEWLCLHCVSPLCERCGEAGAVLLVGSSETFRLCVTCRDAPDHARKGARPLRKRGLIGGTTEKQRDILYHALGGSHPNKIRRGVAYRNNYCAKDGDADCEALVGLGLMGRGIAINEGRDRYYHATQAGMRLVGIRRVSA